jgi:hypothetical protein
VKQAEFVTTQVFLVVPLVNEVAGIRNHAVGRIARRDRQRRSASFLLFRPPLMTAYRLRFRPGVESGCHREAAQSIVIDPDRRLTPF